MGEEWRRGWHAEVVTPKKSDQEILVVGGGPAGLECARALGQRGYKVVLVEERAELGGRVALESRLPGLSEWRRVIEWRLTQLKKLPNVSLYPGSFMSAKDILEEAFAHVIMATGSQWRRDGIGRSRWRPLPGNGLARIFTPDDLMTGRFPEGRVVIFDDDHFYMGSVLAEQLARRSCQVTVVTPAPMISYWAQFTLEQERIQKKLIGLNIKLYTQYSMESINRDKVTFSNTVSGDMIELGCDAVVLVTDRLPNDGHFQTLRPALSEGRLSSLRLIGDAEAPNIIAQAIYSGYLAAIEFDEVPIEGTPFRVETIAL
jgi:dimethylamine/trimethylamine dehydrogenase